MVNSSPTESFLLYCTHAVREISGGNTIVSGIILWRGSAIGTAIFGRAGSEHVASPLHRLRFVHAHSDGFTGTFEEGGHFEVSQGIAIAHDRTKPDDQA